MSDLGGTVSSNYRGASGFSRLFSFELVTVVSSTIVLLILCLILAPSSVTAGAFAGSLPFAAAGAIVGLGQMLVVQQRGFDLSVPGAISFAVVMSTHYPAGNDAALLPAVLMIICFAIVVGLLNGFLVSFLKLNAIVATIGMNALLFSAVFAVSGGVPRRTTNLLAEIAGGTLFGIGHAVYIAVIIVALMTFVLKMTVAGRRFEGVGANPLMAGSVGLNVRLHEMMAYVYAQLLFALAGLLLAGLTSQPTAFQGNSYLLPSVAMVVLGGTSLMGGRGFPVSTAIAAFFLTQLGQLSIAIGVPYSAQTIIQAVALGFGIAIYSFRRSQ
ncbi:ABC transporter permease [Sinisalibacter aestuarii]|uniref:Ribose ABC transporter permease n=1 Tax=Sinisalibacter aestuarii TaxID=2949426 RepID=A0ABQ5LQ76_9RHOB|nr:ABC transporter permease [Sinisalibacter aestuarii]GKY87069.1 ribose ABC transporter permease [Sinisalibacter aestuarii]